MDKVRMVSPGPNGYVTNEYGVKEAPPKDWMFLRAGDSAITRKVTSHGEYWRVQVKKGRRLQSVGIWAPKQFIEEAIVAVEKLRETPEYHKRKNAYAKARDRKQEAYTREFREAVIDFLNFDNKYKSEGLKMAELVTSHAIPIGSGTVARSTGIPIQERAQKAVMAWMRHKTTDYDNISVPRVKGARRKLRKKLIKASLEVLEPYRNGSIIQQNCPLKIALQSAS